MKGLEKRLIKRMNTETTFIGLGALEIGRNWGIGKGAEIERISSILLGSKNINHIEGNLRLLEKDIDEDIMSKALEIVTEK